MVSPSNPEGAGIPERNTGSGTRIVGYNRAQVGSIGQSEHGLKLPLPLSIPAWRHRNKRRSTGREARSSVQTVPVEGSMRNAMRSPDQSEVSNRAW